MVLHGFWALFGGFWFAGPNFLFCYKRCQKAGRGIGECLLELVICLMIAASAGALLSLYVAEIVKQTKPHQVTAVAAVIGLLMNPLLPAILKMLSGKEMLKSMLEAALRVIGGKA